MHTLAPEIPAFDRDEKKDGEESDVPPPPKPGHAPHVELLQKKDMVKEKEKWKKVTEIRKKEIEKNKGNKDNKKWGRKKNKRGIRRGQEEVRMKGQREHRQCKVKSKEQRQKVRRKTKGFQGQEVSNEEVEEQRGNKKNETLKN